MCQAMVDQFATAQLWYDQFAVALGDRRVPEPAPQPGDDGLTPRLLDAFAQVRRHHRADGILALLRLLWMEERLEELRGLQVQLSASAAQFVDRSGGWHRR